MNDIAADNARQSAFYAENDRTISAGPDEELIDVTYLIDNHYEDGEKIKTTVETQVPPPPSLDKDSAEYQDWEYDHVFCHTGADYEEGGDAAYFVTVASSSRPEIIPVGTEYEFC